MADFDHLTRPNRSSTRRHQSFTPGQSGGTSRWDRHGVVCVILYLLSRYLRPEGPWQRYCFLHDHLPSPTSIAATIGLPYVFPPRPPIMAWLLDLLRNYNPAGHPPHPFTSPPYRFAKSGNLPLKHGDCQAWRIQTAYLRIYGFVSRPRYEDICPHTWAPKAGGHPAFIPATV